MPIGFSGGWRVRKSVFGGSFCGDTLFNRQSYFIDFFFSKRVQGPKSQPGSSAQDQRKRDGTEDDAAFDALRLLRCSSNKSCYRQHISRDCPRNALGGFGDKRGQGCDGGFGSFAGFILHIHRVVGLNAVGKGPDKAPTDPGENSAHIDQQQRPDIYKPDQ